MIIEDLVLKAKADEDDLETELMCDVEPVVRCLRVSGELYRGGY